MNRSKLGLVLKQKSFRAAAGVGLVTVATAARADGASFDVSAIVSVLTAAGVACAAVGVAYLTVIVGIKTYKLIQKAL